LIINIIFRSVVLSGVSSPRSQKAFQRCRRAFFIAIRKACKYCL